MVNIFNWPQKVPRNTHLALVSAVLIRDDRICQMCGATENDLSPIDDSSITIWPAFVTPIKHGGKIEPDNMKTFCSACLSGIHNLRQNKKRCQELNPRPRPEFLRLLAQTRRATIEDQKELLEWLLRKFKLRALPRE